jgi:(1->4)-alpha-D-glucan 1-alpha-D-glucosylmutase
VSVPRATMRLQFHKGFTFDDAVSIVPYLAALNVSHLYASPIMAARAGSTHGYDVIDPTRVNPELGGEPGLRRLVAALRAAGLGIIVDIVPNHMAVSGGDNPWWLDVLQHGRQSRYAGFFDIDWEPDDPALHGKILVPVLQRPYGEALVKAEISLAFNGDCGRYEARYFHHVFPIAPRDWPAIGRLSLHAFNAASVNGRRRLHGLLERQHFRLAWWRAANDEINWRRFFDINELAGLRVEDDKVFQTTHATMFRLFAEGLIDGVRVDHVDGLSDPGAYCRRLRGRLDGLAHQRPPGSTADHAYVVVEKILGPGGQLPDGWECDGTSGYDFMDQVSRVLHDPAGAAPLGQLWASLSSRPTEFEIEEQRARREILDRSFSAQLAAAVTALHRICRTDLVTRDLAWSAIRRSLIEILAHMRVYRTYATPDRQSREDEDRLAFAVSGARRTCLPIDRDVVDQVAAWLSGRAGTAAPRELRAEALRRFQQLSAPLAAKAVEDTAFYRYGRLLSRVDVGFDPANFADGIAAFHQQSRLRAERFPYAMLATATHDHKRGEDVRARLAVLSEIPGEWSTKLDQWIEKTTPLLELVDGELAPSRGDVAMLFQTIVGAWPPELSAGDSDGCVAFAKRLVGWQQKALREAKLATDWTAPNESYEAAARQFLTGLFATDEWLAEIAVFAHGIAPAGAINGLAQTLLKLTAPGIPDIYQGTEFWDLSLVDPDNRRPVDFRSRMKAVGATAEIEHLACAWRGGWVKQAIIRLALEVRRTNPMLFSAGDCVPLTIEGHAADHVLAFARQHGNAVAVTVVCRLASRLLSANDTIVIPAPAWGETRLHLAGTIAARTFRDALAGVTLGSETGDIPVSEVLAKLPVALLVADRE